MYCRDNRLQFLCRSPNGSSGWHQMTTGATMKAATRAGLPPTPPAFDPSAFASTNEMQAHDTRQRFRPTYVGQQIPAHRAALDLHQSYATKGDKAALRTSARAAVAGVKQHIAATMQLQHDVALGTTSGM